MTQYIFLYSVEARNLESTECENKPVIKIDGY
ncbi:hypothetical protein C8R26_101212 [Nitrosomonas oligotropha]|uniref:Uncharacterized protein n=1 Tax=Nitrosomonas oligotropha TaxID=42354 RepID=A0A2T5I515_9PROT|nr:hypothetical protein C8R26_101212 [Nitrosomonas oligotropha]